MATRNSTTVISPVSLLQLKTFSRFINYVKAPILVVLLNDGKGGVYFIKN